MHDVDRHWLARFRRNVRAWYVRYARDLPWRRQRDPYAIWISEIMLQQTTVAAVVPYYERFLQRFPTVATLAAAPESDVLRYWEGLGYYSRARNIHTAARRIVEEHGGRFPAAVSELQQLPGIGRYTAGAIASFAFDARAPIVEANTLRLYCRLLSFDGDPRSTAGQALLWEFAERILPRNAVGEFNQALMELGGIICTPSNPQCAVCPARSCCRAAAENRQSEIPRPKARPEVTAVTEASIAVRRNGQYLLRRREHGERWAGLWDFVRFTIEMPEPRGLAPGPLSAPLAARLTRAVAEHAGIEVTIGEMLAEMRHSVTRYRIRLLCVLAEFQSGTPHSNGQFCWIPAAEFADFAFSVTGRKFAALLEHAETSPRNAG